VASKEATNPDSYGRTVAQSEAAFEGNVRYEYKIDAVMIDSNKGESKGIIVNQH
jgi:hypothetical protein